MSDQPVDPKLGRFTPVVRALQSAIALVAVASVAALLGGPAQHAASVFVVGVLIAVPLLRIAWLIVRWIRRGDPKFALIGGGVLAVVLAGTLLSR
ncbi:MAG: hypothetical protein ACKOYM_09105 [Actinomycetes bacterium]